MISESRQIGTYYEKYAIKVLEKQGYSLLYHSFTAYPHEIDIIMKKYRTIVFFEVKARIVDSPIPPSLLAGGDKIRNLFLCARAFLRYMRAKNIDFECFDYRFDSIGISFDDKGKVVSFVHTENYFEVNRDALFRSPL